VVLRYLVYESSRSVLTLTQQRLTVKQKYEHCRIELMCFDLHSHHHVKVKLTVAQQLEQLQEHQLQFYMPRNLLDPMVMKPVTPNDTVTTANVTPVTHVNSRGFLNPPVK
jgi:hypothetical protein